MCALQSGGDGLGAVGWWWLSPGYSERVLLRSRIIGARLFAPRNLIDASCSKGDALALLDVRLREYTEKGLDGHNLEKLRDYVAETY